MKEQEKQAVKESLRNGNEAVITSVLPQGNATGFFLVRKPEDQPINEPLMARKITLELMDGTLIEVTVNRIAPDDTLQGIAWQERLKELEKMKELEESQTE